MVDHFKDMSKMTVLKYIFLIITISLFLISCDRYKIGVKKGEGFLSKSLFFKIEETKKEEGEFIRTIQVGNFDTSSDKEIVIFSRRDCFIFDEKTRELKRTIKFNQSIGLRPELLRINNDGTLEIMLRGGGFGDVGIADAKGEFIWKYKQIETSPRMTAGDLDRDGEIEFYIADNTSLNRLDYSGKKVWKVGNNRSVDYMQIYDPGGDKIPFIVTRSFVGGNWNVSFWDNTGKLIKEIIPEIKTYELEIIKWPDDYHILAKTDYDIIIMDLDGKVVLRYRLKEDIFKFFVHLLEIMSIRGVPVRFEPDKKPYLAVITGFRSALSKTMLSVFSPEGQLVYQEMLNSTRGINVVKKNDGPESLVVGDGDRIWLYDKK